jgi:uncharacterized protein YneF (UPF0154 family)
MGLPGPEHLLFIPCAILLGVVIGWILGGKAARQQLAEKAKRARE